MILPVLSVILLGNIIWIFEILRVFLNRWSSNCVIILRIITAIIIVGINILGIVMVLINILGIVMVVINILRIVIVVILGALALERRPNYYTLTDPCPVALICNWRSPIWIIVMMFGGIIVFVSLEMNIFRSDTTWSYTS